MKKMLFLLGLIAVTAQAQNRQTSKSVEDNNGQLRIQISTEENGKKTNFNRSYSVEGLTPEEKQALVDRVCDSLGLGEKNPNRRFKMQIDDNNEGGANRRKPRKFGEENNQGTPEEQAKGKSRSYSFDMDGDLEQLFRESFGNLGDVFQGFENNPEMQRWLGQPGRNHQGLVWRSPNQKGSIQRLEVYPNNPNNNRLNVSFSAPAQGDVTVTITDIQGKEMGREIFKDFTGAFVGQIELRKTLEKGTYFVTVVQGLDGDVQRLAID
jgi:Secretion system C-terminal sorting domain